MIQVARWAALTVGAVIAGASCARTADAPHDAGRGAAPVAVSASASSAPALADTGSADAAPPVLITDDECRARGGKIVTEKTYAHLTRRPRSRDEVVRPFKVCRFPSPQNGHACSGDRDCGQGQCFCTGDLARPNPMQEPSLVKRDGEPAIGVCSDELKETGTWWCVVAGGKARPHGLIID